MPKTPKQHPPGPHPKVVERIEHDVVKILQNKLDHAREKNLPLDHVDVAVALNRVAERYAEFLPEE